MFAFIHIRKTGGSTVDMILRQSFGTQHCRIRLGPSRSLNPVATAGEVRRCRWIYWNMKCISGHGVVPHADLDSLEPRPRYFTFLREPLSRCASDYQFRVVRGGLQQSFNDWVRSPYAANQQTIKIAGTADAEAAIEMVRTKVGFVGLLERFDESLVLFKRWSACPRLDIRYRKKNVSNDSSVKRQLLADPNALNLLREVNQEDLKLYKYVVDEHVPGLIRRFRGDLDQAVKQFLATNTPPAVFPRQVGSMLLREVVYKPLASVLRSTSDDARSPRSRAA